MHVRKDKLREEHTTNICSPRDLFFLCLFFIFFHASSPDGFASESSKGVTYPLTGAFQEVWKATLGTLETEEIPLLVIDEGNGYIQSKTFPLYRREYKKWSKKPLLASSGFCMIEIGLVKESEKITRIGIRAHFKRKNGFYFFGFRHDDKSKGVFEKRLIGKISDRLVKMQIPKLDSIIIGCNFKFDEEMKRYRIMEAGEGTLAYEQGLRNDDVLAKIDGKDISPENLFDFFLNVQGETVRTFTVRRGKKELDVPVSIFYANPKTPRVGIQVARDSLKNKFKITHVTEGSPAERGDLKVGDILLKQGGWTLDSWLNYYRALMAQAGGGEQIFVIVRGGAKLERKVTPTL